MSENEDWYDKEIAPKLSAISHECNRKGLDCIFLVEYEPGEHGRTASMSSKASVAMQMVYLCAKTAPNIDAFIIALKRHADENKISTAESIVMSIMFPKEA